MSGAGKLALFALAAWTVVLAAAGLRPWTAPAVEAGPPALAPESAEPETGDDVPLAPAPDEAEDDVAEEVVAEEDPGH